MENEYSLMQLINSKGDFNVKGVDEFMQKTGLSKCGLSYAVVAIMGPQSSGKSTLLNHLFGSNFREMDASKGRNQTTQGIWMEKCAGVEPFIIAMDLEGNDGNERGEDDTAFEKQSALFALAIADIVIVNMWCHDVGREHGANKPLLRTVFQVMMSLFSARKTTMLFVLRDKTKTPLPLLEQTLKKNCEKIWDSIPKPANHIDTLLSDLFNVEVTALSSYEEKEELFKEEVAGLRRRLLESISRSGLVGDRQGVVPASEFSFSAQKIWKSIKENKDLDLPAHKVMVATVRCEQIANEKLHQFLSNKDWLALQMAIQSRPVSGFGNKLSSILETYFSEYDKEAFYFDENVRNEKREQLKSKAFNILRPLYLKLLGHLHSKALENFKSRLEHKLSKEVGFATSAKSCINSVMLEFDQACADASIRQVNWDTSEVRKKLSQDIDSYKSSVFEEILSKVKVRYQEALDKALSKPLDSLFELPNGETWASIRKLLSSEIDIAQSGLLADISGLELEVEKRNKMIQDLRDYARNMVERKAREEARKVLHSMTVRFSTILNNAKKKDSKKIIGDGYTEVIFLAI
ncbi:protein ROOT HAIR DEFECTIVE 3 homolog 2-like [Durio zibethinus]|uniref:Protein ROOT HAIR DEFECTIVE 3 homolog 2-like n=1 Tax=Durio zibethinus TaxID=66656 RepID=A0A6P6AHC6_DURZI|nr:protein ROOT HAIR DEFECTIVE 3 homolog 2-like [Durio zibethinus]